MEVDSLQEMINPYRPTLKTGLETDVLALLTNTLETKMFYLTEGDVTGVHPLLGYELHPLLD